MSVDFSNLAQHSVAVQAVPYRLFQIEGEPVLRVLPATEENKPYFNALLRQTKESLRSLQATGASADAVEARRKLARDLIADHVLVGWEGVVDASGREVAWSKDDGRAFLEALPGWIFDSVQSFCQSPANFTQRRPSKAEVAATSGN